MAYIIEFSHDFRTPFYQEFLVRNIYTGAVMPDAGVNHKFVLTGWGRDYGCWEYFNRTIASTETGEITEPYPGLVVLRIPPDHFRIWHGPHAQRGRSLRYEFLAVGADLTFPCLLAKGTISFEGR